MTWQTAAKKCPPRGRAPGSLAVFYCRKGEFLAIVMTLVLAENGERTNRERQREGAGR